MSDYDERQDEAISRIDKPFPSVPESGGEPKDMCQECWHPRLHHAGKTGDCIHEAYGDEHNAMRWLQCHCEAFVEKSPESVGRRTQDHPGYESRAKDVGVLWEFLWGLLDDIDTAGDIFKDDNVGYRKYVEAKQKRRWESGVTSDGYTLTQPAPPPDSVLKALSNNEWQLIINTCPSGQHSLEESQEISAAQTKLAAVLRAIARTALGTENK